MEGFDVYILDIEASGLNEESYPIEIAWCALEGADEFSVLINPESAGGWDSWDDFAESAIHGISRSECCERGENVVVVANRLEQLLNDHPVFSDAPYQDQQWLNRLFDAVGKRCPAFLLPIDQAVSLNKRAQLNKSLVELARPHRAMADCFLLKKVVQTIQAIAG
jgi:hypothetical protein